MNHVFILFQYSVHTNQLILLLWREFLDTGRVENVVICKALFLSLLNDMQEGIEIICVP